MRKDEVPVMELEQTGSKRSNTSESNNPASRDRQRKESLGMSETTTANSGFGRHEEARRRTLAEVGTREPCPFCGRARVQRSDYVRCIACGVNWCEGDDLSCDPRNERFKQLVESLKKSARTKD